MLMPRRLVYARIKLVVMTLSKTLPATKLIQVRLRYNLFDNVNREKLQKNFNSSETYSRLAF